MGKVKPSRVITPRIVQPGGGGARTWLWMLFLIALAAWSWQVLELGRHRGGMDVGQRDRAEADLRERIAELEEERDVLRAAAARFERAAQIDRAAAEQVQSEVKALQDERADLKSQLAFLKSLVPGGGKKLVLDDYSLTEIGDRTFRFEVTLSKRSDDADTVSGNVTVSVTGELDGEEKTFDMAELTDGKRSNIGIKFKNFQKLKTELQLPAGFVPASIEVAVKPDGKAFKSFEQAYDWKASEA